CSTDNCNAGTIPNTGIPGCGNSSGVVEETTNSPSTKDDSSSTAAITPNVDTGVETTSSAVKIARGYFIALSMLAALLAVQNLM
uniref:Uncharacterized protein n=1 Tax=Ciona intestinalis TaxID=7719 RepID=H2XMK2_CIOIN